MARVADGREPAEVEGSGDLQVVADHHVARAPVTVDERGRTGGGRSLGLGQHPRHDAVKVGHERLQDGSGAFQLEGEAVSQQGAPAISAQLLLGEELAVAP